MDVSPVHGPSGWFRGVVAVRRMPFANRLAHANRLSRMPTDWRSRDSLSLIAPWSPVLNKGDPII